MRALRLRLLSAEPAVADDDRQRLEPEAGRTEQRTQQRQPSQQRQQQQSREPDQGGEPATDASGGGGASAEACDRAIDDYDKVLDKFHRSSYHPSFVPWAKRVTDSFQSGLRLLGAGLRLTLALPGMIWSAIWSSTEAKKQWWKGAWKTVAEGAKHYWVGTKLLGIELWIATRLVLKIMRGKELSRRENKQLMRTVADVFRLVPMVIFLVVPFLEFLLPVALKLFPNMLPSTFEDKLKKEEKLKKRLAVKIEVARFLQDTVALMARDLRQKRTGEVQASAAELYQFMKRVRRGEPVDNADIIKFGQLFNDELTLDNLDRVQLVSMCQFVGLSPFGTDSFLQTRLRAHLGAIKRDDYVIRDEGVDSLTEEELRQANRARGMRAAYGEGAKEFMKKQLIEWLELSLDRALPSSLLLLSRAFTVTLPLHDMQKKKQIQLDNLKSTLSILPENATEDVAMEVLRDETEDNKRKLDYIKREEELIREEEQKEAQKSKSEIAKELPSGVPEGMAIGDAQAMAATTTAAAVFQAAEAQLLRDAFKSESQESEEERAHKLASAREQKLKQVLSALAVLSSSSGVSGERSKFMSLVKREVDRIQEEMGQRGGASLLFTSTGLEAWRPAELPELPGDYVSKRLSGRVSNILHRIEKELDEVDKQIGENLHLIDKDGDGMISRDELGTALGFLREQLGEPELRRLLEEMCNAAQKDSNIDVEQFMQMANKVLEPTTQQ